MNKKINIASTIILCAGRGKRMRYKTKFIAKPLVKIKKKSILEFNLNYISYVGIKKCVINNSYKFKTVERFISNYSYKNKNPVIFSSKERVRLETGGGIKNALHLFEKNILAINGDSLLIQSRGFCAITKLYECFNSKNMDILLLLAPIKHSIGYQDKGDFVMASKKYLSKIERKSKYKNQEGLVFTGWQIIKKELFNSINKKEFSLNILYDMAQSKNKLYGIKLDGKFLHLSTPKSIIEIENFINKNKIVL